MAYNKEREKQEKRVKRQLEFCSHLMQRLVIDVTNGIDEQNEDKWDNSMFMRYKSRHETDIVRIRRELNTLIKIMRGEQ